MFVLTVYVKKVRIIAREKIFENKVKAYLKSKGAWFVKYWGGGLYTQRGIPDILCCYKGRFIAIETKAETGHPSDLQLYQIRKIKEAGGIAMVLYPKDFDEFKKIIENL